LLRQLDNPNIWSLARRRLVLFQLQNILIFSEASLGHWLADNGRLTPVGYVYLAWIFPGSVVFLLYVVRNISIALLLRDVVARSRLHVLPLHPDRAGGLQPVGRLGLRNQYALTAIGLNFVAALAVAHAFLEGHISKSLVVLLIVLFVVYIVVSPVIFYGTALCRSVTKC